MELNFTKEENNRWYINLPSWTGSKDDLEMVMGADTMLDIVSNMNNNVCLDIKLEPSEGYEDLFLVEKCTSDVGGAIYILDEWKGTNIGIKMWLCSVTLTVFGFYPQNIFFKKV